MTTPIDRPLGADPGQEPAAAPVAAPQVCGEFNDKDQLDTALSLLEGSSFQRADLSVRYPGNAEPGRAESTAEEPMREDEARNLRQLGAGVATAAVAMAAAGGVVASGGALLPAIAAAAASGGATLAATELVGAAQAPDGETSMHQAAETTGVVLLVHAETPEKQARAKAIMADSGATRVWVASSA